MPLRAKILNPALAVNESGKASNSTYAAAAFKERPGDEPDDVLFGATYGLRTIQLNRPKKLNSLNGSMIRKIVPRLQEWKKSQLANIVVIKGEGRAFCAGGDVAALAQQNHTKEGQEDSIEYFAQEYQLDHLIATYTKPYVAFIDGITMGGGVGLSAHAPFRIATENTVFAMPETTIGLFPDVGAGFFLSRMDGGLGLYLALTSEQLRGTNVFYAGVATHYLHSSSLPDLEQRFSELHFQDDDNLATRLKLINSTIEEFCTGLPHDKPIAAPVSGEIRKAIDYAFQPAFDYDDIIKGLDQIAGAGNEELKVWANKTKATIAQRSPTSVKVTIRQLREGRDWTISETFRKEHVIAAEFMRHPDFIEGVSSLLIRKPKTVPQWSPAAPDEITSTEVDKFFAGTLQLELLDGDTATDYKSYPHAWTSLPTESQVGSYIQRTGASKDEAIKYFVDARSGKLGVKEKVSEIIDRKAVPSSNGSGLSWEEL